MASTYGVVTCRTFSVRRPTHNTDLLNDEPALAEMRQVNAMHTEMESALRRIAQKYKRINDNLCCNIGTEDPEESEAA